VAEEVKQSWQTAAGEQYLKINKIVSVQAAVLVVILTVFVYIILKLKRNTKKHYEK
jgi:heme/copper-type cytochrome/quinol oxidase subunit 2